MEAFCGSFAERVISYVVVSCTHRRQCVGADLDRLDQLWRFTGILEERPQDIPQIVEFPAMHLGSSSDAAKNSRFMWRRCIKTNARKGRGGQVACSGGEAAQMHPTHGLDHGRNVVEPVPEVIVFVAQHLHTPQVICHLSDIGCAQKPGTVEDEFDCAHLVIVLGWILQDGNGRDTGYNRRDPHCGPARVWLPIAGGINGIGCECPHQDQTVFDLDSGGHGFVGRPSDFGPITSAR